MRSREYLRLGIASFGQERADSEPWRLGRLTQVHGPAAPRVHGVNPLRETRLIGFYCQASILLNQRFLSMPSAFECR